MQETLLSFSPFPRLSNAHAQTLIGAFGTSLGPPSHTALVRLSDGDRIAVELSTPPSWRSVDPTVVLIHGLCGSHRSSYMARMARRLYATGTRVARMNMRGCGSGQGLARHLGHSGRSEDALAVIDHLIERHEGSAVTLVGFSLGGNIVLKLAGELGGRAHERVRRVIAVCPPVDLLACSEMFLKRSNRLYERRFVQWLRKHVRELARYYPDLPRVSLPPRLGLIDFDDHYTAPMSGFENARSYYDQCSSLQHLHRVTIPCHILVSDDDPFIDSTSLARARLPVNVQLHSTTHGGHLGFLAHPRTPHGVRWMDAQLMRWIAHPVPVRACDEPLDTPQYRAAE